MGDELVMKSHLKGRDFDELAEKLRVPGEGASLSDSTPSLLQQLGSLYPVVNAFGNKPLRKELMEQYDKRATELWRQRIDSVDSFAETPGFQPKAYLQTIVKEIGEYKFTSESTREALLGHARAKSEEFGSEMP